MQKCPLYLVTGFLGSGKTTFIKNIIDFLDGKQRVAIVQNEFAPANMDGKELKRQTQRSFELLEVNNGSVFCLCLLSGFIQKLEDFVLNIRPDIIIMEASGLSDPVGIGEIFNHEKLQHLIYLAGTFCIIDAHNFLTLTKFQQNINHQVMMSDHLIINKSDLCIDMDKILSNVAKLNPSGQKHVTTYCDVSYKDLLRKDLSLQTGNHNIFFMPAENVRPLITSIVFKSAKTIKAESLESFIAEICENVIRLKGYLRLNNGKIICIQSINKDISIDYVNYDMKQSELIALSTMIDIKGFREKYLRFAS